MKSNDSLTAELLNCTPSSIHLHAAHLSLHLSLCNTINVIRTKISHIFGQFSKTWADRKNGAGGILVVLIPNLDLNFWNSNLKIQYLGKFGSKNSKLSVLPKNWHTWYLEDVDSYSNIRFQNLQPYIHFWANLCHKITSFLFCLKICSHGILRLLIVITTLVFRISKPKSIFGHT